MKTWSAVGKSSYEHGEQTKTIRGLEINDQTQTAIKILRRGEFHIPVDKTISIPDVEPLDCTQDFCCCNETKYTKFNWVYVSVE